MYRVAFLLLPEFSLLSVVSAIETLRVTNSVHDTPPFGWTLVHDTAPVVPSSNGIPLTAETHLRDIADFDALLICGSFKPHKYENRDTQKLLRRFARFGKCLGAMETGVYHLARAGLLSGHPATAHFNSLPLYSQLFPDVKFEKKIYTFSEQRMTCAGGISSVDMMLRLVGTRLGRDVAGRVASMIAFPYLRDPSEPQYDLFTSVHNKLPQTIRDACRVMEETIQTPVGIADLAERLGVSRRHLDRLFRLSFSTTAANHYRMIRLARARKLLKSTTMDLGSISEACGFSTYSQFSQNYRKVFHVAPASDRRGFQSPARDPQTLSPLYDLHPFQSPLDPQRML